jgi:hypothetical protein
LKVLLLVDAKVALKVAIEVEHLEILRAYKTADLMA